MENEISDEPAFKWWVKDTLQHRYKIIPRIISRYWPTSHKFGIRVPKKVKEAYDIYRQSGTGFWNKSIAKDITNVRIAFGNIYGVTPD